MKLLKDVEIGEVFEIPKATDHFSVNRFLGAYYRGVPLTRNKTGLSPWPEQGNLLFQWNRLFPTGERALDKYELNLNDLQVNPIDLAKAGKELLTGLSDRANQSSGSDPEIFVVRGKERFSLLPA